MAYEKLEILINGKWISDDSKKFEPVINPATGEVLGQLPHADSNDLDEALSSSAEGFQIWRNTPAIERQAIMEKAARLIEERHEEIATNLTLEMGKPITEARLELSFSVSVLRWYAEEGKRAYGRVIPSRIPTMRQMVMVEPIGPAIAFVAWNFPAVNVMRKVAGALGAGCSITIKASEETPATCIAIARAFMDAGLPAGVLNVVFGVPDEVSRHLISSPIPRKLSFTGSVPVGAHLQKLAADTLKRCTMELGGHAPVIIFDDCDVEEVAKQAVVSKFRNAGQVCVSPTRFYVQETVQDRFADAFAEAASNLKIGNGIDEGVDIGPLIAERRISIMEDFVSDAVEQGAELLTGGQRTGNQGSYFQPTVLKNVPETAQIMNEEPFGPVAPISTFRDFDDVIAKANRLQFGLASYGFTSNGACGRALADQIDAGLFGLNSFMISTPESPFGGVNFSGYGSEGGTEGLNAYLRTKFVTEA
jgi:succinate-semialdehyde dehydrogenase/glutarate-semialdehyde dehydrogenase